ncbi:MAG: hypothetical protein GX448_11130 [Planctomycetes bacterium]|nr:hypothetical protein [Planctomycetota bacterium]
MAGPGDRLFGGPVRSAVPAPSIGKSGPEARYEGGPFPMGGRDRDRPAAATLCGTAAKLADG